MKTPKIPAHPKFGPALSIGKFGGCARRYAWYVAMCACILNATVAEQCGVMDLGRAAYHKGLQRMWETGTLESKPRECEPTLYTTEVMRAAKHILSTSIDLINGKELFEIMKGKGYFQDGGCRDRFLSAFKAYCLALEDPVTVNSTRTTFYLAPNDYALRAGISWVMYKSLKYQSLDSLVFCDEVILEEVPHSKGEPCLGNQ